MIEKQGERNGVTRFGYVMNLSTFIKELNVLLNDSETPFQTWEFNNLIDSCIERKDILYFTKLGAKGTVADASYATFDTKKKGKNNEDIIAVYEKHRNGSWTGISFSDEKSLKKSIKTKSLFNIGELRFESWKDGLSFLNELESKCIPEKWTYQNHKSTIPHPVLKSYIENTFQKLKIEDSGSKILTSDDGKVIIFNTGLLDLYFHEIYLMATVVKENNEVSYLNPYIYSSLEDLKGFNVGGKRLGNKGLPESAQFFSNINDVMFHDDIEIDRNPEKFNHIIDDRRERFPESYKEMDTTTLAIRLDSAIDQAIALAKRNYKLIVPMYRPQENKLQLLMPIYLSGKFSNKPDFALVLNLEDGYYVPETILPLDAAYQNARLIAKPDNTWLNPEDI